MPISVGDGTNIAPNLPKSKRKRSSSRARRADPAGFARALGIGPAATTNPIQEAADRSRRRLERTADRLSNRRGLRERLETRGVTAREFDDLRATSNAHDRRLLDDFARRAARLTSSIARDVERNRRRARARLIMRGVSERIADQLTAAARLNDGSRSRRFGRIRTAGVSLDLSGAFDDLHHRLGPLPAFASGTSRTLQRTGAGLGLVAKEAATDPIRTAEDVGKMAFGGLAELPELAAETATSTAKGRPLDPVKRLGGAFVRDLKRRYGPLYDGDVDEFKRRLEREGAAAELLDVASILSGAGVAGGRAAGAAARAARLRVATEPRPGLQLAGAGAREQRLSKNLITALAQRGEDRARRWRTERKVAAGDALASAARRSDNVLPLNPRQIKKPIGRAKGAARLEQQALLDAEARSLRRARRILTRQERDAFKYAVQYGIRSDSDVEDILDRLAEQIAAKREETAFRPSRRDVDELALIDRMAESPRDYFTPILDDIADEARNRAVVSGRRDPTMSPGTAPERARRPQAALLEVGRREPRAGAIPDLEHDPGVDAAELGRRRREAGLAVGGYFPSRRAGPRTFVDWTMGSSLRGPGRHRQYSGRLRELGIENNAPELLDTAIARNINNQLRLREVTRTIEQQALPWSKGEDRLPHHTAARLYELGADEGLDPRTWVAVSPKALDEAMQGRDGAGPYGEFSLEGALREAVVDGERIAANPARYRAMRGYVAIPRAVFDEIIALEQPTGRAVRAWNNAKGGFSRLMLGLNPTWLPFQVAGNVVQTALSGAAPGRTRALREAMELLSPDERRRADALLGVGQMSEAFNRQHMGSLAGRLAQSWQELKETRAGRVGSKINPIRAMFELDRRQNNAFRHSVASAELKRIAREAEQGATILDRLLRTSSARAEDYAEILRNPQQLERLATHTNKFLGDFTSMTAIERRALVPTVMFYGWLRHSLKLLFWTMPTTRPIVGSIIGQLGKLHAAEIRELFGDDAPEWLFTYAVLGRDERGQPIGINAARFIPFANAVADPGNLKNPYAAPLLMAPPFIQAFPNAAFGEELFSGRRLDDRGQLFLQTALGQPLAPSRVAQRVLSPKEYEAETPAWRRLLEQVAPVPRPVPYTANGRGASGVTWK